ncbi:MAG: AraC family transcriptional regulator [Deltaproteobacteria bacterium]|nr:AraC family transcriptional regulator [Deltaproteobacteria bacterium]
MAGRAAWGDRILRVVDHVQAHLDDELQPEDLAQRAGLSLHHFHRVFRGLTGESVMGFVRRLRLERAAQRLRFGDRPVTEVAFGSGYGSHEAFTRAFRSRFGQSPSDYRSTARVALGSTPAVEFREQPAKRCLARRHVGPYQDCGQAWDALMDKGGVLAAQLRQGEGFGLCYDDPEVTPASRLRYDACLALPESLGEVPCPDGCVFRTVPGGRYAVTTHAGSFDTIFETYVGFIGRSLPFAGVELTNDPIVEIYLAEPTTTPPDDLLTEICVRLA